MKINDFVLIIGAMKSGTTSLFNYLADHPQIAACSDKEPSFFSKKCMRDDEFEGYQNLWNDWNPNVHKLGIEASTSYTRITNPNYANAAENIAKFKKEEKCNFKFLYVMRNPIDRIESQYTHAAALKSKELRKYIASKTISSEAVDVSKYSMQIDEYYQRFDAKDILLIHFEDIKNNPVELLQNICRFLEIDSNYQFQKTNTAYNRSKEKMIIRFPGWYMIRHSLSVKLLRKNINSDAKKALSFVFKRKVKNKYIKLSFDQKQTILRELETDIEILETKYNFDVSRWNLDRLV